MRILRLLALAATLPVTAAWAQGATSCVACHGDADLVDEASAKIVTDYQADVHATAGLSCHDCHGGNPDASVADDPTAAMADDYAAHPFVGAPAIADIPRFCGRCHSDPAYMRRFKPDLRVDQEQEYHTSQHGIRLAAGDQRVATCVSCHGVHGIRAAEDSESPVYPTHVAETCKKCHADAAHMAGSRLPDGRPLPVDQYALWRQSVHAHALLDKGDLSAPTCNDCHGNHGASPPGVDSIAFVCGQCHGRETELFQGSPKKPGFEEHNEMIAEAEAESCAACHDPAPPAESLTHPRHLSECTSCHRNHGIVRPTVAMLSPLPQTPCAFCHESENGQEGVVGPEHPRYVKERDARLAQAASQGLEGEQRFDWLVDQALALPFHRVGGTSEGGGGEGAVLRPEFARLFEKFRIGKTTLTYEDPVTGETASLRVIRCGDCHQAPAGGTSAGLGVAADFIDRQWSLTSATAQAERLALRARRGGVETRQARAAIEQAVNAQIELEVLVHSFDVSDDGKFVTRQKEGITQAQAALKSAQEGLAELGYRRKGLAVSLLLISLVLVGLALKIRGLAD